MRALCQVISVVPLLAGVSTLATSQSLTLDLAKQPAGSNTTESIRPGSYAVLIENRVPGLTYNVTVLVRTLEMKPLAMPEGESRALTSLAPTCPAIDTATRTLRAAYEGTSEKAVSDAVDHAEMTLKTPGSCAFENAELKLLVRQSRIEWLRDVELEAGQEVVVTVERPAEGKEAAKTWQKTFTTGARGNWRTTYGFAAAFTRLGGKAGVFEKRDTYFLQTSDDTTTIKRRKDRGAADFIPAVLFHFMPTKSEASSYVFGPNAGVSFDGTNPTVMVGYGVTYQQNVNLSLGYMGRRERVLLPKYDIGDMVSADLTEDQLTEMKLRIRPYVVLTFRLSTSPFSSGDQPKEKPNEEKKDAKK